MIEHRPRRRRGRCRLAPAPGVGPRRLWARSDEEPSHQDLAASRGWCRGRLATAGAV